MTIINGIRQLFVHNEQDSLKIKARKGAFWTIAINFSIRGLGLLSSIIVTRLLFPEDFGILAIATAITSISTGITQTGFQSALIQKQNCYDRLFNTAWTLELFKGVILFAILFSIAPIVSNFYEDHRLTTMLRTLSLTFVMKGLENIGVTWFRKNLDIRK